jgi:hypothetical protein
MPGEIDASVVEALRGLVNIVSGARQLILAVASTLPEATAPEDEAPEEGAVLLGSRLRTIVCDRMDPALASLEWLIEEALGTSSPETEE